MAVINASGGEAAREGIHLAANPRALGISAATITLSAVALTLAHWLPGIPHSVRGIGHAESINALIVDGRRLEVLGLAPDEALDRGALAEMIQGERLDCSWRGDRTNRATCTLRGDDLALLMLQSGRARFSGDAFNSGAYDRYLRAEFAARQDRRGVWRGR